MINDGFDSRSVPLAVCFALSSGPEFFPASRRVIGLLRVGDDCVSSILQGSPVYQVLDAELLFTAAPR